MMQCKISEPNSQVASRPICLHNANSDALSTTTLDRRSARNQNRKRSGVNPIKLKVKLQIGHTYLIGLGSGSTNFFKP